MKKKPDPFEWWVLIDPKTDTWARVTEEEAKKFPVVQTRCNYAISMAALEALIK